MEFSRELDLCLDALILADKGFLGKLYTKLVFTRLFSFVLVLHVGMDISIEKLGSISVSQ